MKRITGYLAYLLIPAIPYLLMIYRPDLIDPVFQYLAHGKGHRYVWILLIVVFLWSLHAGITFDFRSNKIKRKYILFTKWYLVLLAILASMYVLLLDIISFKYLFIGVSFSVIAYYLYAHQYGKQNA